MLRIAGGRVYDPANGIAGDVRDVCVQDGKIVEDVPAHARRIDARGMVVMPGGVDIHAHIAGPAVNASRKLSPEEHRADVLDRTAIARSGTGGTVPSTFATGYRYALLGYTTVVEAATPPLAARHTLAELRDTPVIDALFLVLMGNNLPLFELIRTEPARVREAIAWWLQATGGYGVKLVNPGGVEMWKRDNGNVTSLDD
ncbi:MAG TPA: amidohydrolase family protein, partial [Solirubrobacteraceae bacterium]